MSRSENGGNRAGLTRLLRRLAFWVVLGSVTAACGVPLDRDDRPLRSDELAFTPRTEPPPTTSTTTTTRPANTTPVAPPTTIRYAIYPLDVYWISDGLIKPVRRFDIEANIGTAIAALTDGPRITDTFAGLRSAIPSSEMIVAATAEAGTAVVNLAPSFLTLPGTEQVLAIAQIVYTVTVVPGLSAVEFRLQGNTLAVPTADGEPASGPVTRDDYRELVAPPDPADLPPIDDPKGARTTAAP